MPWRTPETVELPIELLEPNPWNPNVQPEHVYEALRRSIREDGFLQPLVVRPLRPDGTPATPADDLSDPSRYRWQIIAGVHRWRALRDLGWDRLVPCVVVRCGDAAARRLSLTLNMRGRWDEPRLGELLQELAGELDVQELYDLTGLDRGLLDRLLGEAALPAEEPVPEPPAGAEPEVWTEMVFHLTPDMAEVVRRALEKAKRLAETDSDGHALVLICQDFLATPDESFA